MTRSTAGGTRLLLILFLMSIAVLILGSLYLDMRNKNALLTTEVERLKESQVLLMVPDKQAEAIAGWLANNPHQTQMLLKNAMPGAQTSVMLGANSEGQTPARPRTSAGSHPIPDMLRRQADKMPSPVYADTGIKSGMVQPDTPVEFVPETKRDTVPELIPEIVSETQDGVKVISLPHGGIRVTTREDR